MSTSVKMSKEGKDALDILQAKILLASGKKLSQQELLDLLVKQANLQEKELIKTLSEIKLPLNTEEQQKVMSLPTNWGIKTKEEEIDQTLYG